MRISNLSKCTLAFLLAFLPVPIPTHPQESALSSPAPVAEASNYPDTKAGLQQLLNDIRDASKANDSQKVAALLKITEIPNCDAWLHAMYESDKADSWMGLCDAKTLSSNEKSLAARFSDLVKADGEFVTRKVNDDPEPGRGMEWSWLQAIRQPLDIYFASWKGSESVTSEPVGYFMFIDGGFRWESGIRFVYVKREAHQLIEGTTYINRTAHFTLAVPPDWHVSDSLIKPTPDVIGTVVSPQAGAAIIIQRYDFPGSLESAAQIVEGSVSRHFRGYHKISEAPLTIDGKDAISSIIQFDGLPGSEAHSPGKMLMVFIRNGDSVLGLMCMAPDPLFDQIESTFQKIVNSYDDSTAP